MSPIAGELAPTARLRFVRREDPPTVDGIAPPYTVLQQFWAPDVPGYMRDEVTGEWRDVPYVEGAP